MPRRNTQRGGSFGGPQLSHTLLQKLGVDGRPPRPARNNDRSPPTRKEQRKLERVQRGAATAARSQQPTTEVSHEDSEKPKKRRVTQRKPQSSSSRSISGPSQLDTKRRKAISPSTASLEDPDTDSRSSSPGLVLDSSSRAFKERATQDEEEILALEKKLGLKTKKLPKLFDEDGLGELLDGLDSDTESKKRKREGQDWLARKRRTVQDLDEFEESGTNSESDNLSTSIDDSLPSNSEISEGFGGFSSDDGEDTTPPTTKKRENPYIAPGTEAVTVKYIPPSLRKTNTAETESMSRIRRQIQGHLNKLSEANIISILNEVESMYRSNARQNVTTTLIDLLLSIFSSRSSLQNTFVILHAAFIAAVYKIIGTGFGAEFVAKLTTQLDHYLEGRSENSGKESNNLVSLLSYLFTFNVINSVLVFNYLTLFLKELTETNAELILRIVRDCGPQLRQDDPSSLKMVVQLMYEAKAKSKAEGIKLSVRTDFMTKTIEDLKNNKMRTATSDAGVASEHITQMRKALGSLNKRSIQASEPLRISRDDIKNSDKRGKWWLVGASWKGEDETHALQSESSPMKLVVEETGQDDVDLWGLARQYRMNTDVRRSIFISLMSAHDVQDAHMRLVKLRLKRAQEQEIPKVILRCAGAERPYNPYYSHVAKKLCSDKKMKTAFQFAIWNFFKRLGEDEKGGEQSDEEAADGNENDVDVELEEIVNLAKMYAELILEGTLNLTLLKVLNIALLKEQSRTFLEVLLITILRGPAWQTSPKEQVLVELFSKVADAPQLLKPLQYFIKKQIRKSDLVAAKDREKLKRACTVATDTLALLKTPSLGLT